MNLVDLALLLCPREFRSGYRRDFDRPTTEDAFDVARTGLALRFESLSRDVVFALRSLLKSPLFTGIVLLTLALAISVNAAIFSITNALLLKPLPFVHPERLMFVCENVGTSWCGQMKSGEIGMLRRSKSIFEGIAAFQYQSFTLTGFGVPQSIGAGYVSANYFDVQRIRPELGRFFKVGDARPGLHDVVISHKMWQQLFNGSRNVVGRTIALDGVSWHVIGVAPAGIATPTPYNDSPNIDAYDLWTPMPETWFEVMQGSNDWAVARLMPGVTEVRANAEIARIKGQMIRRYPVLEKGLQLGGHTFTSWYYKQARPLLYLTFAGVLAVLLIACANIANLLLARGIARRGELAVRNALGAARRRILQQLIVEIGLLTLSGGALGLALAWAELKGVAALGPSPIIPNVDQAAIDARVALFTFAIAAFAALLAGVVPAFLATGRAVSHAMRSTGRNAASQGMAIRSGLSALQIALAFAVIIACGLLYRSFLAITATDVGVDPGNTYVAVVDLFAGRWDDANVRARFVERAIDRIRLLPGVDSVSIAAPSLWSGNGPEISGVRFPGRSYPAGAALDATITQTTPGFLQALHVPLLRGRSIAPTDGMLSSRVAVLDDHSAQRYFGGSNPLGKTILLPEGLHGTFVPATVVGVVGNILTLQGMDEPRIYIPNAQFPARLPEFFIRTRVRDPQLRTHVAQAIAAVDPQQSVQGFYSLQGYLASQSGPQQTSAALFAILAAISLLLALAGIYGIMAYSVERRRHEIGVRMAIGAKTTDIIFNVLRNALGIAVLGIAAGVAFAGFGARMLSGLLFQTSAFDPLTFVSVIALLLLCVTAACSVPAMRAASVNPAVTLRYE